MSGNAWGSLMLMAHLTFQVGFVVRALLRPHRQPAARIAWVLVILTTPAIGMMAYVLFGETNIGRERLERYRGAARRCLEALSPELKHGRFDRVNPAFTHLFETGISVSGLGPISGNEGVAMPDSEAAIDALVADIDAAESTVHLLFYIWLADESGLKVAEAAMRAAERGVTVRAMADDIGSRRFIRSPHWAAMEEAGVKLVRALPVGNLLLHPIRGRIDLRNHRKIAVIDNRVAYCGSQNCADPEFRIKPRFAPWVDVTVRFAGPVAVQSQCLFAQDWMAHVDEDLTDMLQLGELPLDNGFVAQVIGTGPTVRSSAMPEVFEALIHSARRELVITTPYYVPSEAMHEALCAVGRRGVRTLLILPKKNDSWVVAAASRSYYWELIAAGVRIFEYPDGLLHSKLLTLDGEMTLIGSANLDRRSFDLNYENNILLQDHTLTGELRERQERYKAASHEVVEEDLRAWSVPQRLWHNAVAMLGPVL